jgi:hypothetical protein
MMNVREREKKISKSIFYQSHLIDHEKQKDTNHFHNKTFLMFVLFNNKSIFAYFFLDD